MKTMNRAEAEGLDKKVRRRAERTLGIAFLVALLSMLVISVWLFATGQ
jgi:hypothetical protein